MPTPVSAARQCLTDEAARALDEAVAVARRRSHAQTTSLHAVSALLALPSAVLRDACRRAARSPVSHQPRLHFRALELSVGVSLDRLPTAAKSTTAGDDGPPISNSLMAAIKRSQANQRRNPGSFHFMILQQQQQQQQNQQINQTTSFLKVELKHFILSILDDPIVSRVFGEAGFRSYDIKLALLQPPPLQSNPNNNRFLHSKLNRPVFLCNFEPGGPIGPGLGLPYIGLDPNCRRIVEILGRKEKRNPLLMGVYAKGALGNFIESVQKGRIGFLPTAGLSVMSVEKEIEEFVTGKSGAIMNEEKMGMRFEEIGQCLGGGGGAIVSFGEVEVLVRDGNCVGAVGFVVERLRRLLLEESGKKVWLVGVAGSSEAYSKFLGLFPTVDRDWDLQLLTVTTSSATPSSLMGSFVPFGGFFPTPSEFRSPISCTNAPSSSTRCHSCNEKYEQEVADTLKVGPAATSTSLPWLQKKVNNVDTDHRGLDVVAKTNEDSTRLNAEIFRLQRKWSDICQRVHHNQSLPEFIMSSTSSQTASPLEGFQFGSGFKKPTSSTMGLSLNEIQHCNQIPKQIVPISSALFDAVSINNTETEKVPRVSKIQRSKTPSTWFSPQSSSSITPVTTDLGLGTIYNTSSIAHEPETPKVHDHHKRNLQQLSDSLSTDISSPCSVPKFEGIFDSVDFKSLYNLLTEKVGWQDEAVHAISRAISLCRRSGAGRRSSSRVRADVWLAFHGPDRIGKGKMASAIAECLLGNRESLIAVDLSSQEGFYQLNSIFELQSPYCHDLLRRKTVVDYIAGELSKNPCSVVFLENVEEADFLVQSSLFQAIRTGRFPYSFGREISISNSIFIVASTTHNGRGSFVPEEKEPKMFPEQKILEAKRFQMQLSLGHASEDAKRSGGANVKVLAPPRKGTSKPTTFLNKRKLVQSSADSKEKEKTTCKTQKLDLNMPFEEVEECNTSYNNDCESESELVESYEAWLHDFCEQVDGEVVFKPFDFGCLAEQVTKRVGVQFQKAFGSELVLEIEYEVMAQILAAAWLSDKKNAVEDWVEHVLGRTFAEAQQKYHYNAAQHVMKLVKCESNFVEEQAHHGVCLPARINLN